MSAKWAQLKSYERERERRSSAEKWAGARAPLPNWQMSASASAAHFLTSEFMLWSTAEFQAKTCNKKYVEKFQYFILE